MGDRPKSLFRRRLGLILVLLALDTVLVLVAVNDVDIRHQLRTTSASLASAKTQLSDSRVSLRILNTRFRATQSQNAEAQSSTNDQRNQLEGELSGVIDLLQGNSGNTGTAVGAIATVKGVGATLVFTSVQSPSTVSLTTVITGASPGRTYAIGWGLCPENVSSQTFAASAVATSGGFVILPKIHVAVPADGVEFWLRLHEITPPGSTGVLGGVINSYFRQGESLAHGSPVPPTRAAC
jgi:hypothetical protein